MIPFIYPKETNWDRMRELIALSQDANRFTHNGPVKALLEQKLSSLLQIEKDKEVICVGNGTLALAALMHLYQRKLGPMRWVVPSFGFPSALCVGENVQTLDINDLDGSIDPELLDESSYDGIILNNLFGTYVDISFWEKYCKDHNKILIFDNASSPLSIYAGKSICNFGDASFSSLHQTKTLGFGEGGFLVINKEDVIEMHQILKYGDTGTKYTYPSSNFKMADPSAAFILQHIEEYSFDRHIEMQNYYLTKIKGLDFCEPFNYKDGVVYGNMALIFNEPIDHRELRDVVFTEKYYKPLSNTRATQVLYGKMLNLPLHHKLMHEDIDLILGSLRDQFVKS